MKIFFLLLALGTGVAATIACRGFFDNNANEKLDRKDTKDTLVYDLVTLKQVAGAIR